MKNKELVILVDEEDNIIGSEEKMIAHQQALLHRAFSVFVFYKTHHSVELLIQQRQFDKYHCGGLWTNTCCSHPRLHEDIVAAGERRLYEELGIQAALREVGVFHYTAKFDNGLTENEIDHVLVGFADSQTVPFNHQEVHAVRWVATDVISQELAATPAHYTPWFEQALTIALNHISLS